MASADLARRVSGNAPLALYRAAKIRQIEATALSSLPPHILMRRAGGAAAAWVRAIAPHALRLWIVCGSGNNGGDGLQLAAQLREWAHNTQRPLDVRVTWLGNEPSASADSRDALQAAQVSGVQFTGLQPQLEADWQPEVVVDALLGIGVVRSDGTAIVPRENVRLAIAAIARCKAHGARVLALDGPSGLNPDTGAYLVPVIAPQSKSTGANFRSVEADASLHFIAAKPGAFTAQGKDASGEIWLADLGVSTSGFQPDAWLWQQANAPLTVQPLPHSSHKGSRGDVWVLGGAAGMQGAALLAGRAALHGCGIEGCFGAGRVYVGLLSPCMAVDAEQPELMLREAASLSPEKISPQSAVVLGCGAGVPDSDWLLRWLQCSAPLVIDADALNAIAASTALADAVRERVNLKTPTVLTPHPLEAARLLQVTTAQIQSDRLRAAQNLAEQFGCHVVLKGAGTVVAHPNQLPSINGSGNANLATAGTGDVLAGFLGSTLAEMATRRLESKAPDRSLQSIRNTVFRHGALAPAPSSTTPFVASDLLN